MAPGRFGRPGRPREDRLLRRREIFLAIAPIILKEGARAVTMRRAAVAAHLSVGGIYHYFPNRRALLLYGAQPEATTRLCADFFENRPPYADARDPWGMALDFIEFQRHEARLVRPAVRAAVEMGREDLEGVVAIGIERGSEEFAAALARVIPAAQRLDLERLGKAIRRLMLGSVLDRSGTEEEMVAALRGLLVGSLLEARRSRPPRVAAPTLRS